MTLALAEERAGLGGDVEYTRVKVDGQLLNDREIHLYALDDHYGPGFHVITPLRLADGSIVLVNRGFVPNELKDPAKRAAGQLAGDVELHRSAARCRTRRPCSFPTTTRRRTSGTGATSTPWPRRSAHDAPRVHHYVIDAEANPPAPGGWPKGGVTRLELPNRHLEYALTWYGLAGALVAVFAAFAITRWRQPAP